MQAAAARLERLSPRLQQAARYVTDHPREIALNSMRAVAKELNVAPATMLRLARALGYGGYDELRRRSLDAIDAGAPASYAGRARWLRAQAGQAGVEPRERLQQAQQASVRSAQERNAPDRIGAFCAALRRARRAAFVGQRSVYALAFHWAYVHGFLFDNALLLDGRAGTLQDEVHRLDQRDVLVAISVAPYTRSTLECVETASAIGVQVLALTDSALSPLAQRARHSLHVQTDSPSFFSTLTGALALIETLLQRLAIEQGEGAVVRLAAMDERLRKSGAYWDRGWRRPPL